MPSDLILTDLRLVAGRDIEDVIGRDADLPRYRAHKNGYFVATIASKTNLAAYAWSHSYTIHSNTLPGIDTPTLLGVWASAPYFHDGSAPTLDDVFRVAGGQRLAAEAGAVSGGAILVNQYVALNNDDTVRGRAFVSLEADAQRLSFSGVDGAGGGIGAVEIRYSTSRTGASTQPLTVRVNGVDVSTAALPATNNDPAWRATRWRTHRIEDIPLNPGAENIIELRTPSWYVAVDEIVVSSPADLAAATPHRRADALPAGEHAALLAFLRQLDSSAVPFDPLHVFGDGFE